MTEFENPFTPSFGEIPAHVAGRRQIIADVTGALAKKTRSPELTSLFSGARGTGKTTLLSVLANKAEGLGWISVNVTALPGMLDDIEVSLTQRASHLTLTSSKKHITGVQVAGIGGISISDSPSGKNNWRSRVSNVLDELSGSETGLFLTVDEIDPELPELVELVAIYQHFVREGRKVALMMAGLPGKVSNIQSDKTVSFLRRAQGFTLGRINDFDVRDALVRTIAENGRTADEEGLEEAVSAIAGFPFLLQLIGYRAWNVSPTSSEISGKDFKEGISIAKVEMKSRILEATYREFSEGDVKFTRAMLEDEGETKTSDLVLRLGWSDSQVAQYRRRLIDAGVIGYRGRGRVGFELPYFREFLLENE